MTDEEKDIILEAKELADASSVYDSLLKKLIRDHRNKLVPILESLRERYPVLSVRGNIMQRTEIGPDIWCSIEHPILFTEVVARTIDFVELTENSGVLRFTINSRYTEVSSTGKQQLGLMLIGVDTYPDFGRNNYRHVIVYYEKLLLFLESEEGKESLKEKEDESETNESKEEKG